jgi:pimeloyl-ACP methyl ester carboxylesterase
LPRLVQRQVSHRVAGLPPECAAQNILHHVGARHLIPRQCHRRHQRPGPGHDRQDATQDPWHGLLHVPMPTERFTFTGHSGDALAARLDLPEGPHLATALFAHCFTCGKDIAAARRIAQRLTAEGIAVLRFDFTGLGHSAGEFQNTSFTSNVGDLVSAAEALAARGMAPVLLIGHSLGGAAVLKAAPPIPPPGPS